MKSSDEDVDGRYKYNWNNISGADHYDGETEDNQSLGIKKDDQTEDEQIKFWYYKNYNNYVSIRKTEDIRKKYVGISLFLFWGLLIIWQLWKESTAGQLAKDWPGFFGALFALFVMVLPMVTIVSFLLLDYFFACCMPHEQRLRVWGKYGISCPKCFKLAEPINKSRNKYICHNPDCDMQEFANIAHNVSRAY